MHNKIPIFQNIRDCTIITGGGSKIRWGEALSKNNAKIGGAQIKITVFTGGTLTFTLGHVPLD